MNTLQIFAKAPIAGKAKTRLIKTLGEQGAAYLHQKLVKYCLQKFGHIFSVQLWCYPDELHSFFTECKTKFNISLHQQHGYDLGERMANALASTVPHPTVLIGTDCPSLTVAILQEAFTALQQYQVVLGPAEDGGYVLIGMQQQLPELFVDIPWGSSLVLETTRSRLRDLQLSWYELPIQWDVDRPDDLPRLENIVCPLWNEYK
ncbi:TIGR04282 family arsenosugar biosynthesis glycosyltransferase [Candidatus Halobeggiatoa sp. HSG11]|nr:TIGR04282 family arsenosugar biosynthesis glycosyltransferase [Candidatus Halobeggiatoa sp. HSG11]